MSALTKMDGSIAATYVLDKALGGDSGPRLYAAIKKELNYDGQQTSVSPDVLRGVAETLERLARDFRQQAAMDEQETKEPASSEA